MPALILPVEGIFPEFGEDVWLADNATVVGKVKTGQRCTFWFQSVVRGDVNSIVLGDDVNVQDGAIIHGTLDKAGTSIGNNVSIGHRAIIHGCTLENDVLVGMGAIVMDGAVVGHHSIVAAGSVVLEKTIIPPYSLFAGIPAKWIKSIDTPPYQDMIARIASNYPKYAQWFVK